MRTEDESRGVVREKDRKIPNREKVGKIGEIIAPVSYSQRPWTSAMRVDGRWKVGNYYEKGRKCLKWGKLGRGGGIIASFGIRHHPRTSVDIRDVCGRKMESTEVLGADRKSHKWHEQGRNEEIIGAVSFRGHPRCAWVEDGRWGIIRKKTGNALNGRN